MGSSPMLPQEGTSGSPPFFFPTLTNNPPGANGCALAACIGRALPLGKGARPTGQAPAPRVWDGRVGQPPGVAGEISATCEHTGTAIRPPLPPFTPLGFAISVSKANEIRLNALGEATYGGGIRCEARCCRLNSAWKE